MIPCAQVGICGVGISSVLSGQGSASSDVTQSQILLGMALIVCAQVRHDKKSCNSHIILTCKGLFNRSYAGPVGMS